MERKVDGHIFSRECSYQGDPANLPAYDHRVSNIGFKLFGILMDKANTGENITIKNLCEMTGWAYRTVKRALNNLIETGWVVELDSKELVLYFCEDFRKEVCKDDGIQ